MNGLPDIQAANSVSAQAPTQKLGFLEKAVIGVGGLPVYYGSITVQSMAIPVYQMMMGVNPALLGGALAVPRLWDAFIDPLMGNISDNFRSRFGRRKPFIVIAALAMGIAYAFIWMVPQGWSQLAKVGYFIATALIFYTCYAAFSVPYQSLTFEASPDYNERTKVMAHYSFWYRVGDLTYGWIFPLSHLAIFATAAAGIHAVGWFAGIVILAGLGVIPGLFGKERYYRQASHQPKVRFWPALKAAVGNKALLILIALTLLKIMPSMLASSMDQYLLVYYMFDGDIATGTHWKAVLSTAYGVVGLVSIPALGWVCSHYGKKPAMILVYSMVVFAGIAKWFIFVPGHHYIVLLDALLSAPVWVGLSMVIPSMMADVCDDEELRDGERREGTYSAVYSWIIKTGTSLAFLGTGILLNIVGFDSHLGGHQSAHTFFWMRFSFAAVTTVSALIAIAVALYYPITRERAAETRGLLEARRGAV